MRVPVACAVVALGLLVAACDASLEEQCAASPPRYEAPERDDDHVATEVRFQSGCTTLAGTLYQPLGEGPHPTMVFLHGSGEMPRLGFGSPWITTPLVEAGMAVMSYDKRGVGDSGGECCPDEDDDFETLTADGLAAVDALAGRDDVGPIGLLGVSQGGWVIPKMVARSPKVAYTVILSGSAVSVGEEITYSDLTGEPYLLPSDIDMENILRQVREEGPSGFDPRPLLRAYRVPGLWIYGARDGSQPTALDVEVLERIEAEQGRDFTVEVFPDLGHDTTHDHTVIETMLAWLDQTLASR
ncbi:MAG TPA: alpha/beta hydrolase [Jiangellaceae bacterium]